MGNKSLLLIWQDKKSRLFFHIGTLSYDGYLYQFEYTHEITENRSVNDAMNYGYQLLPTFPDLKEKYKSERLFPSFARRIPSANRNDYEDILQELNLPSNADEMDLLRATRGMMGQNPYTFTEPLQLTKNNLLTSNFYIHGMRYGQVSSKMINELKIGEQLILERDYKNPIDRNAVKILTKDRVHLGYVPGIFAKAVSVLLDRNVKMKLVIQNLKPDYSPQWWVYVSYQSRLEQIATKEITELDGLIEMVA